MSKKLAITLSKSTKETQGQAVKQAQRQQYRYQCDILDITVATTGNAVPISHPATVFTFRL